MIEGDYSINTGEKRTFGVVDYVLFAATLAVSAGIGFFYAIKDRNRVNTNEYLLGGRKMYVFPVAMSLLVTFMSALTLLGTPAEIYNYHTMFWYLCLGMLLAMAATARIFIPFFYNLQITSSFEYLEMRFGKVVRILGSSIFIVQTMLYMSFVLYAPSLALNAVTGFDLWGSLAAVGCVVTLYTALGGMKAVLWTDTFQAVIIAAGLLAALIQGSIVTGGFENAWEIAANRSRVRFDDFSFDPSTRHSFWALVVGAGFFWMSLYGTNQAQVQRVISCSSAKKAQLALLINTPGLMFIISMCCMIGIVMYAFYSDCHPIKFNGLISKTDQLLPLFVLDILGHLPGLPGIFISCLFSGSLSTLSSGLNALGAVILQDLVQPYCLKEMNDRSATILSKIIVVVFGLAAIGLAYLVSRLGTVLQASYSVYSIINGPLFGLFVLGMFFPWANKWGALAGCFASMLLTFWIGIGAFVNKVRTPPSDVFTHGCNWTVVPTTTTPPTTTTLSTTVASSSGSSDPFYPMYTMSYLFYTPTAMITEVIVGLIISFLTGYTRPSSLDPRLVCPLFDRLFPCLPEKILKPLRFGIVHKGTKLRNGYRCEKVGEALL